jgi:hypothetical protein
MIDSLLNNANINKDFETKYKISMTSDYFFIELKYNSNIDLSQQLFKAKKLKALDWLIIGLKMR